MPVQGLHISLVARALKANGGPHGPVRHLCQRSTNAQRTTYVSLISFLSMGKDCHWSVWVEQESLPHCHRLLLQMVWNQGTPQLNFPSCYSSTQGTLHHSQHSRSNNNLTIGPRKAQILFVSLPPNMALYTPQVYQNIRKWMAKLSKQSVQLSPYSEKQKNEKQKKKW